MQEATTTSALTRQANKETLSGINNAFQRMAPLYFIINFCDGTLPFCSSANVRFPSFLSLPMPIFCLVSILARYALWRLTKTIDSHSRLPLAIACAASSLSVRRYALRCSGVSTPRDKLDMCKRFYRFYERRYVALRDSDFYQRASKAFYSSRQISQESSCHATKSARD